MYVLIILFNIGLGKDTIINVTYNYDHLNCYTLSKLLSTWLLWLTLHSGDDCGSVHNCNFDSFQEFVYSLHFCGLSRLQRPYYYPLTVIVMIQLYRNN